MCELVLPGFRESAEVWELQPFEDTHFHLLVLPRTFTVAVSRPLHPFCSSLGCHTHPVPSLPLSEAAAAVALRREKNTVLNTLDRETSKSHSEKSLWKRFCRPGLLEKCAMSLTCSNFNFPSAIHFQPI